MNIEQLRADTPGTQFRNHLNNAGSSLPPRVVLEIMQEYLSFEAVTGGYEAYAQRESEIKGFYDATARMLQCKTTNVAFTGSATDAFIKALSSIQFESGDVILTSLNDYTSNQIQFLALSKKAGVRVIHVPDLPEGGIDPQAAKEYITRYNPRLFSLTHVPTNSGLVQDVHSIGQFCKDRGVTYLVDACQSVGQMPVDPGAIHCDFLSATMRKFLRGPRGAGFLYVSDEALSASLEPMFIEMRGADWTSEYEYRSQPDARRFEEWERNYALILGSAAAIRYAMSIGIANIRDRTFSLAAYARSCFNSLEAVEVVDEGEILSGIVTIYVPGGDGDALHKFLLERGINTAVARLSGNRFDFGQRKQIPWALRISPHYYNTEVEIDACAEAVGLYCESLEK